MDSAVDFALPDTLVCGMTLRVNNTAAGSITVTAPTACAFQGGGTTLVMAVGTHGHFVNNGGKLVHARVFSV
jgi:hypothetical protein